jgi:hypothetical protein
LRAQGEKVAKLYELVTDSLATPGPFSLFTVSQNG